jgi:hypothetical protein
MSGLQLDEDLVKKLKAWTATTDLPAALKALGVKQQWQLLLTPLGQLPQEPEPEVSLPLLDKTATAKTSQFGWDWSATAGGTAAITVDVIDEALLDKLKIEPGKERIALSVGADLALSAGMKGNQAIGTWGQASAAFSAAADAKLHWYFGDDTTKLLIDALAGSRRYWLLPNDYAGLMSLAPDPDFWGLRLDLNGKLQAQLSAGAKQGWSGWTYGLNGDRAEIGLSIGVDASVKFAKSAEVSFHVRPERRHETWGLKVELEVLDARSDAFTLTLAASLDLSALAASAERALRAAWPEINPAALDVLTKPGTALGKKIVDIVNAKLSDADVNKLALIALGQADAEAAKANWIEKLTKPLTDALDGSLDVIAGNAAEADALVSSWLDRLLGDTQLTAGLKTTLKDAAKSALIEATAQWKAEVDKVTAAITSKTGDALDLILKPLGALGDKIDKELKRLNGAVPESVVSALTAYGKARKRLLAALSDAKKARLGLTLAEQIQRSKSRGIAVAGWFSGMGDQVAAQNLYHSLCSGRIALLGDLVDAAQAGHSFELDSGWLTSTAKEVENQSAVLSVFGSDFTDKRASLVDMEFKADLWGRLIAAKAIASVDSHTLNPWLERTAALAVSANLNTADGIKRLEVKLDGAFTARGKKIDQDGVQDLVDSYAALVGIRPPRDIGLLLGAPNAQEKKDAFWRDLTIAVPVKLNPADWKKFEDRPRDFVLRAFLRRGLQCLDQVYAGKKGFNHTSPSKALREKADEVFKGDTDVGRMVAYLGEFESRHVNPREPDVSYATRLHYSGVTNSAGITDTNLQFTVFHRFAGVLRAAATLHGAASGLRQAILDGPPSELPTAVRDRVERPLRDIRDALEAVAVASQTLSGFGEDLSWPFGTFVLAMAELTDILPPGFLMVAEKPGAEAPIPLLVA